MPLYPNSYEMLEAMVGDAIRQLRALDSCGRVTEPTKDLIARLEKGLLVAAFDRSSFAPVQLRSAAREPNRTEEETTTAGALDSRAAA